MRTETSQPFAGVPLDAPRMVRNSLRWMRQNLFNTWYNSLLTLLALAIIYQVIAVVLSWGVIHASLFRIVNGQFIIDRAVCDQDTGACWAFIASNWYLFLFGTYPYDERWRPMLAFGLVIVIGLISLNSRARRSWWVRTLWLSSPVWVLLLVRGANVLDLRPVDSANWGGLMLSLILGSIGIVASFPIGILLALGRRSTKMPIIKALCVVYIEVIRGVPLITVLFMWTRCCAPRWESSSSPRPTWRKRCAAACRPSPRARRRRRMPWACPTGRPWVSSCCPRPCAS